MNLWTLLEYAAWIISGLLGLWMIIDASRTSRKYGEDVLLSSREGEE